MAAAGAGGGAANHDSAKPALTATPWKKTPSLSGLKYKKNKFTTIPRAILEEILADNNDVLLGYIEFLNSQEFEKIHGTVAAALRSQLMHELLLKVENPSSIETFTLLLDAVPDLARYKEQGESLFYRLVANNWRAYEVTEVKTNDFNEKIAYLLSTNKGSLSEYGNIQGTWPVSDIILDAYKKFAPYYDTFFNTDKSQNLGTFFSDHHYKTIIYGHQVPSRIKPMILALLVRDDIFDTYIIQTVINGNPDKWSRVPKIRPDYLREALSELKKEAASSNTIAAILHNIVLPQFKTVRKIIASALPAVEAVEQIEGLYKASLIPRRSHALKTIMGGRIRTKRHPKSRNGRCRSRRRRTTHTVA